MNILCPELLHATGLVTCGMSTRHGGVSPEPFGLNMSFNVGDSAERVQTNRELFVRALGIGIDQLAIPGQVHGNLVQHVTTPGSYPACDGIVTDTPGVCLCISVADCVPIFIVEKQRRAIAAIHAGWRGTSLGIVERGVEMLAKEFQCRPEEMIAYVGPSAGVCCYSVGEDVAGRFSREFVREKGNRIFLDLRGANVSQLARGGVPRDMIEISPLCTIDEANTLHSFRRDRERSGRMMGFIALKMNAVR